MTSVQQNSEARAAMDTFDNLVKVIINDMTGGFVINRKDSFIPAI